MSFLFLLTGLLAQASAIVFGIDRLFGDDPLLRRFVLFVVFMIGASLSFACFTFL